MVKTTRQIRNEEDRFGGYIPRTDSARRNVEVDLNVDPDTELSFSRRTFVQPEYSKTEKPVEKREEQLYSTLDNPRRTVALPPRPQKTAAKRDVDDVMPKIRSREETGRAVESAPVKRGSLLSSKTKIMLAVYIVAAITLAAVVIATGIALSSGTAAVSGLENSIAARSEIIASQTNEIRNLEDDTMLTGMATQEGMHKVNSVVEIELLGVADPIQMTARTNWFDKFCDWLGNIF